MIGTSRAIYTDPIMLALVLAALARMQDYRAEGGLRPLLLVSALTGLAMGAKYPAVVLLLPLAWTLTRAHGRAVARAGALALLVVAITFLATSPYVLLDHPTFLRDVRFDRVLATEGLLGATGRASGWSTLAALGRDLGPVAVLLALAGLALMVWRDRRRPGAVAVTLAGAAFLLPIVISPLRFERQGLPVGHLAGLSESETGRPARPVPDHHSDSAGDRAVGTWKSKDLRI